MDKYVDKQRKISEKFLDLWEKYISLDDDADKKTKENYLKELKMLRDEYILGIFAMQLLQMNEMLYRTSSNLVVPDIDINTKIIS